MWGEEGEACGEREEGTWEPDQQDISRSGESMAGDSGVGKPGCPMGCPTEWAHEKPPQMTVNYKQGNQKKEAVARKQAYFNLIIIIQ